ncbi:AAA family ATPase [Catenulispora sp. NF23]|uniref:AAA family ATPase n=1 Tax=Catenulispora pinistramenti TaxID=2705254 RepID=A0ABS5KQ76_9ACTN|nr:BTAD domain-containing putative transcriptional regulator [Catenulispora pinistramenti]MBS2533493.1 AAA family ATPase [Catenulispora pinistramenti]MBS2548155.1 AAA family ATPase [Catenulispora pinistramenti]
MSITLTLLGDVRWHGVPVVGERPRALLAALAARDCRPVGSAELIELVWGEAAPSNGVKGLQVLVSRTRSACGVEAIVREEAGYRLGAGPDEVDSSRLSALVRDAAAALDGDPARAETLAREALALAGGDPAGGGLAGGLAGSPVGSPVGGLAAADDQRAGPLAEIRRGAATDAQAAGLVLARAASRTGGHAQALPHLEAAYTRAPHDESLLADLLRSEAAVRGPAAALERFERHRRELRDRLGTDPGEPLRRVQRGLLALDRPVRHGLRYDATELIGRDADLERLRAALAGSRVVSVVGAGGLGKTRLAQLMAREAEQAAVYFVELAGVVSGEDLAAEVGSVLGVRDSVSGRGTLTASQRADIRARLAQQLGLVPGLLVLDNCEHLIEAVAELVAFLIAATPDLRVLTTSRAPLAIAAERVYPLGELGPADAARLFRERALAARPDVRLDEPVVAGVVGRLDGLPLAIELAAAKVRVMAVEEIDRRLQDRFALLRGGDRSAPDRHRALVAVIEWSWNLLDPGERRALRRLALFHDGFTLEAAESVLGSSGPEPDVVETVRGLVEQSLVTVRESPAGVRYRMLETVREFGRMRLAEAGDEAEARAAQRRWAVAYATAQQADLAGSGQFAAIDALSAEETNLADEMRAALAEGDNASLVRLLATLGTMWTIRGEHIRMVFLAGALRDALSDWTPPPELADAARAAVAVTLSNAMALSGEHGADLSALLRRLGPADDGDLYVSALVRVLLAWDAMDVEGSLARLTALAAGPEPSTAAGASVWLSHYRENEGDPHGALALAERALALTDSAAGPWTMTAMPRMLLAELSMQLGDRPAAVAHARVALPVVRRLGAVDDEAQLRTLMALSDVAEGRLEQAREEIELIDRMETRTATFGTDLHRHVCRAELLLASGRAEDGLRLFRECADQYRETELPGATKTGTELWSFIGDAMALSAHAWHASGADEAHGRAVFAACRTSALLVLTADNERIDYPASGMLLFGLGTWWLLRRCAVGDAAHAANPADAANAADTANALRLLALAQRFSYNRMLPTMDWERIVPVAERALPGRLDELRAEYADRRPVELLAEARGLVDGLVGGY